MEVSTKLLRYRWIVLLVSWTSFLTVFLTRLSIGPLAPFLKEAFHLSNTQIGSLVSAAVVIYLPALTVAGWLVDRVGVRRMLIAGTLIISLCTLAIFFAPSYQAMLTMLALSGLGSGCLFPSTVKSIILWFPLRERATALGLNQTAVNIGGIIGATLMPPVAIALGWRYGFLFISLGALAICLGGAILYRNPPRVAESLAAGSINNSTPAGASPTRSAIELFKSRDIWMLALAGLFLAIVEFAVLTYLVLYLIENLLFSAMAAGGLLAMAEASGAFGKPASGFASDRLFRGRRKIVFLIMGGTASLTCIVLGVSGGELGWLLYPVLIIFGVMGIGWGGLYVTIAGELGGKELAGVASGVGASVTVLGVIIGPPLFGKIVDVTGSFQTGWLIMALSGAISVMFTSLIREHRKRI